MSMDRIALLDEALALEKAGGRWRQQHVAALTGYSPRFLRDSDCPKVYEVGNGPKGKETPVYVPADVRAWYDGRVRKAS